MDWLHELAEKSAAAAVRSRKVRRAPPVPRAIDRLRLAKFESDRRNYGAKHQILRDMLRETPDDFAIDSEENGIYGFTHVPTSFRIHAPRRVVSQPQLIRRLAVKTAVSADLVSRAMASGYKRGLPPARMQRFSAKTQKWVPGAINRSNAGSRTFTAGTATPAWRAQFGADGQMAAPAVAALSSAVGSEPLSSVSMKGPGTYWLNKHTIEGASNPFVTAHEAGHAATLPGAAGSLDLSPRDPALQRNIMLSERLANRQVRQSLPRLRQVPGYEGLNEGSWAGYTRGQQEGYKLDTLGKSLRKQDNLERASPAAVYAPSARRDQLRSYPPHARGIFNARAKAYQASLASPEASDAWWDQINRQ